MVDAVEGAFALAGSVETGTSLSSFGLPSGIGLAIQFFKLVMKLDKTSYCLVSMANLRLLYVTSVSPPSHAPLVVWKRDRSCGYWIYNVVDAHHYG